MNNIKLRNQLYHLIAGCCHGPISAWHAVNEILDSDLFKDKWISVEDRLPDNYDDLYLCWSVKFGDESRSASSHYIILWFDGRFWTDEDGNYYEENPDYHLITHWAKIPDPPQIKEK